MGKSEKKTSYKPLLINKTKSQLNSEYYCIIEKGYKFHYHQKSIHVQAQINV